MLTDWYMLWESSVYFCKMIFVVKDCKNKHSKLANNQVQQVKIEWFKNNKIWLKDIIKRIMLFNWLIYVLENLCILFQDNILDKYCKNKHLKWIIIEKGIKTYKRYW